MGCVIFHGPNSMNHSMNRPMTNNAAAIKKLAKISENDDSTAAMPSAPHTRYNIMTASRWVKP